MSHCPLKSPSTAPQNIFQTHYLVHGLVIVCLPASSQASLCSCSGYLQVAPPRLCSSGAFFQAALRSVIGRVSRTFTSTVRPFKFFPGPPGGTHPLLPFSPLLCCLSSCPLISVPVSVLLSPSSGRQDPVFVLPRG